uniref:alpha-hydroxy acid oxidase n=1 Tax=Rhodococcus pyridinivorans TaxID=103816 RepID=UPI00265A667B
MKRRIPRAHDLTPLMQFKKPQFNATKRRLDAALTIEDLRTIAQRRTPKAAFDYTDGSAEAELSLERARQAFRDMEFHPAILRDVSKVDTSCTILGGRSELPFGIAPTGFTRMMQTEGEYAGLNRLGFLAAPISVTAPVVESTGERST